MVINSSKEYTKTIIIYGLRRSGNHFLISLILQQFSNFVHINNNDNFSYENYIKWKNIEKTEDRVDHTWTGFKDVECVVISLENKIIDNNKLDKFKKIDNCYFFLLLRCPYCNFSSVWRAYLKNEYKLLFILNLWKIYAEYFINDNNSEFIKVLYDKLVTDKIYMFNMIKKIGVNNTNINSEYYIKHQSSSFGNNSSTQNGESRQTYKTLKTCIYANDKDFLNIVNDNEIENLWNLLKIKEL